MFKECMYIAGPYLQKLKYFTYVSQSPYERYIVYNVIKMCEVYTMHILHIRFRSCSLSWYVKHIPYQMLPVILM